MNDLLLNIYLNYVPNKTVLCDDKDPSCMTNGIKTVIEMKNDAYKEYITSGMRYTYYIRLENLTIELSNLIRDTKTEYYSKLAGKFVTPSTSAKTYCSISKAFVYGRKVPLLINNEFISNFMTKTNCFNRFFNQQCTAISTDRSIPSFVNLVTNETVTTIKFNEQLISKLIVALNPHKVHGRDGLNMIFKPLSIVFQNCPKAGYFSTWKKANVSPVHKKGNKQILNNY